MINFVTNSGQGNYTVVKFGGWDESALELNTTSDYFAKEFPCVPGTWTISLPYVNGGIYWNAASSAGSV